MTNQNKAGKTPTAQRPRVTPDEIASQQARQIQLASARTRMTTRPADRPRTAVPESTRARSEHE
jgi:hypothetical protein